MKPVDSNLIAVNLQTNQRFSMHKGLQNYQSQALSAQHHKRIIEQDKENIKKVHTEPFYQIY